jgi:hypothetical protein
VDTPADKNSPHDVQSPTQISLSNDTRDTLTNTPPSIEKKKQLTSFQGSKVGRYWLHDTGVPADVCVRLACIKTFIFLSKLQIFTVALFIAYNSTFYEFHY